MKYDYAVIHGGKYYPAGTEIADDEAKPDEAEPKVKAKTEAGK